MLSGLEPNTRRAATVLSLALAALGCDGASKPPGEPSTGEAPETPKATSATDGGAPSSLETSEGAADAGAARSWQGPFFTVTSGSAGIYARPLAERSLKLGYARNGGRIPVRDEKIAGPGCKAEWYPLVDGGFICASEGTIDPNDPRARLALGEPDLDAVLPYAYARAARNGAPLYSSVPSRDQMAAYEPYLFANTETKGAALEAGADAPWWQQGDAALSKVRLANLALESDGIIARRMVKGFYVAVDKEFEWSSRSWYKTTKGLVAPKDRFVAVEASDFKGVELGGELALPIAWPYGPQKTRPKYQLMPDGKLAATGSAERLQPIPLTSERRTVNGVQYALGKDGFWVRTDHVRIAEAPPVPADLAGEERWIYVDLPTQTLVASVGAQPAFATLVSSGRESEDEEKDHRTPSGQWTLREKHITTTMDGDGTAAGDLPYSIEDVPYAMYFEGSYALHGAFWHRNFGTRMSHGCVNLAPLDAKYLFFFTGPVVRQGWHGAWAGNGQAGSRLIIRGVPRRASARGNTRDAR